MTIAAGETTLPADETTLAADEVEIRLIIKKTTRQIVRVMAGVGAMRHSPFPIEEEEEFAKSPYGLKWIANIHETKQNPCYVTIGRTKVEVPCG